MINIERQTLKEKAVFQGVGLHSARPVKVIVHPSDDGIFFHSPAGSVEAVAENVSNTVNCTCLGEVSTIEHIMSALAALEITDALIELDAQELPGLDGSAKEFFAGLKAAGLHQLESDTRSMPFKRVFHVENGAQVSVSAGEGHWRYEYDSGDRWPNQQIFELMVNPDSYETEIAPARTFANEELVEPARSMGLGQGLDLESCLLLGKSGYVNEARFQDEPVRHKLLDLIGDLYLTGIPIRHLNVVGEKSGHRLNTMTALKVRQTLGLAPIP